MDKWDNRWLDLSKFVSEWSKDPSTKVGAVMARGKELIGLGYNGFPSGIEDLEDVYNDRDEKYKRIIHAEANLFRNCWGKDIKGSTIYIYPFQPCSKCALEIINHGIKRVVTIRSDTDRWEDDFEISRKLFEEAGVELVIL